MVNCELDELANDAKYDIIQFAKRTYSENTDVPELGDYVPFMAHFGEHKWVDDQITQSIPELNDPVPPQEREDTLVGLLEYYQETGDEDMLEYAVDYFKFLFENHVRDGFIITSYFQRHRGIYHPNFLVKVASHGIRELTPEWNLPPYQRLPRNGVFIELLVDLYDATGDQDYLSQARNLADSWIELDSFKQYGVFVEPSPLPLFYQAPVYAQIFKGNTGVVNGLLALYDATNDEKYIRALEQWTHGVNKYFIDETVNGRYWFTSAQREPPELRFTFPFVDVMCYAFHLSGNRFFMDAAESAAGFWLEKQAETGLIPLYPEGNYSHHDVMTDFSISLIRLAELTGDMMYQDAAERAMEGLFKYHRFSLHVDVDSGEPITGRVVDKFVTLMSKAIIAFQADSIYGDKRTFKLLRDR